jgi:hypothetical protein
MTNPSVVVAVVAFAVNLTLGAYVLRKNPGGAANRSFALLMGSFVLWDLSEGVLKYIDDAGDPSMMFWLRLEWTGIAAIGGVLVHFVLSYPTKKGILEWKPTYVLIYAPTFLIIGLVWATDLVVHELAQGPFGYDAALGAAYPLMAVIYTVQIFVALTVLLRTYRTSEVQIIRKRSMILLMGVAVPVIVGSVTETFLPVLIDIPTRLGIGSIYTVIMGIFAAYAIMKYKLLVIEPTIEEYRPAKIEFTIDIGHNNLVESGDSSYAFNAFRNVVSDTPGLCITTTFPEKIRGKYGLEKTPIVWISKTSLGETTFKPSDLNFEISQTASKFMRDNPRTSVIFDDLEYLVEIAGFDDVIRFIKVLTDVGSVSNSTVVVPLDPTAIDEQVLFVIKGSFDAIRDMTHHKGESTLSLEDRLVNTVLFVDTRDKCLEQFKQELVGRRGLFITTIHPQKILPTLGIQNVEFIWLSESEESPGATDPAGFLEYLITAIGFSEVLEFLQSIIDLTSAKGTRLLVPAHPKAFSDKQFGIIKRRFDLIIG